MNFEYTGQICHRSQIPFQVMGDYAPRRPDRLKKVDATHRMNIIQRYDQDPIPGTSGTPPTKKCKTLINPTSGDSVVDHDNQKKIVIDQLLGMYNEEFMGLSLDNLLYELEKIKRLKPVRVPDRI